MLDLLLLELDQYCAFLLFICVTVAYFCYQNLANNSDFDWVWVVLCLGFLVIVLVGLESDTIDLFRPDMIVEWYNDQPGKVVLRNYNTYLYPIGNSVTDSWLKENGVTSNKKLFLSTSGLHQFVDYYQFYSLYPLRKDPLTPIVDMLYYIAANILNKTAEFIRLNIYQYIWGYTKYEYIGSRSVELFKYKYRVLGGDFFLWRDFVRFDYTGPFIPPYDRFGNKLPGTIHQTKYWISWEPKRNTAWGGLIQLESTFTRDPFRERFFQETRGDLFPEKVYKRIRKHLKLPYTTHTRRADWILPLSYEFYFKGFLGAEKGALVSLKPRLPAETSWIQYVLDSVARWKDPLSFKAYYYNQKGLISLNWAEGGLREEFRDYFLNSEGDSEFSFFDEVNRFKDRSDYFRMAEPIPDWVRLSYQRVPIRRGFIDLYMKGWNQRWLKLKYLYARESLRLNFVFFYTAETTMDGFFLPVKYYVENPRSNLTFFGLVDLGYGSLQNKFLLENTHSFNVDGLQTFNLFSTNYSYNRYYDEFINNNNYRYLHIPIRKDFYDAGVFQLYPYLPKLGYVGYRTANLYPDPDKVYQSYTTYPTRNYYLKKFFKLMTFNDEAKYYVKISKDILELFRTYMLGELGEDTFFPEVFAVWVKAWVYGVIFYLMTKRFFGVFVHNQYDLDFFEPSYVKNPFTVFAHLLLTIFAINVLLAVFTSSSIDGS